MKHRVAFLSIGLALIISALLARVALFDSSETTVILVPKQPDRYPPWFPFIERFRPFPPTVRVEFPQGEVTPTLELIAIDGEIEIQLTNHTDSPFEFYDSLESETSGFPNFVWLRVRHKNGTLVTNLPGGAEDGSWSPLPLYNTRIPLPADLSKLASGETVQTRVPMADYSRWMNHSLDLATEDYEVRFTGRVYLDSDFRRYIESQSEWVPLVK